MLSLVRDSALSKIGRKPIDLGNIQVEIKEQEVHFKGKNASGVHVLPQALKAELLEGKQLKITCSDLTR